VRFVLVGDDSLGCETGLTYKQEFLKRHAREDWLDRVVFAGRTEEADLIYYYSNCDVFVAPSRFESFGLIFLEAMRYGKPVVGCRAGGMPEVIDEGVNGLLAEPGDAPSLTAALEDLIADPKLRRRLGQCARRTFEEKFTANNMARNAVNIYRDALRRKRCENVDNS
jgi:hypothetical protein